MASFFIAIKLPQIIKKPLRKLYYGIPNTHWIPEENLHITLRYLGKITEDQQIKITQLLSTIKYSPFAIRLKGLGYFNKTYDGIIWAAIEADKDLQALRIQVNRCLAPLNLHKDHSLFIPHVSFGYYKKCYMPKVTEHLKLHKDFISDPFTISKFFIYKSIKIKQKKSYIEVEKYLLSNNLKN